HAPGPKFSTSTSDWEITFRNRSLPASVLRFSVRLRLLALKIRKNRLSLFFWWRMFTCAMSPPLGSSSLIASAPSNPRIFVPARPAWLCVMSMMRMPDKALSMVSRRAGSRHGGDALQGGEFVGGQCSSGQCDGANLVHESANGLEGNAGGR